MKYSLFLLSLLFVGLALAGVPSTFDARSKWNCKVNIMAQGNCNCCWSFCSTEVFSFRLCITGEAQSGTIVSMEPILDCSGKACGSSIPATAWNYLINSGSASCTNLCTGGCAPYDAAHGHVNSCHQGKCDNGNNYGKTFMAGSFKGLPAHQPSQYQNEVYANGPLEMCFQVYSNFDSFFDSNPDGVYYETSGSQTGSHCVMMLGWGTQGGIDYWLLANSWGNTFADKGFFKMKRGVNLANIEGQVSVGYTKRQSAALSIPAGIDAAYNWSQPTVGNWVDQEVDAPLVVEVVENSLPLVKAKLEREVVLGSIVSARTKVVENVYVEAVVEMTDGARVLMGVWKNVQKELELTECLLLD